MTAFFIFLENKKQAAFLQPAFPFCKPRYFNNNLLLKQSRLQERLHTKCKDSLV